MVEASREDQIQQMELADDKQFAKAKYAAAMRAWETGDDLVVIRDFATSQYAIVSWGKIPVEPDGSFVSKAFVVVCTVHHMGDGRVQVRYREGRVTEELCL